MRIEKTSTLRKDKVKDYIFYCSLMAIPLIMFVIVNFVIGGQAIFLGFQEYDAVTDEYIGMNVSNFKQLFQDLSTPRMVDMLELSLISWGASMIICNIIPISFSFYVY